MLQGLKFHFDNEYITEPVRYGPVLLWQIGDIGCDAGYVVKDHIQYCHEITCVVGGRGWISSNGREYKIEKGWLYINKSREIHRIRSDTADPIRYFYIGFEFDEALLDDTWRAVRNLMLGCKVPLARDNTGVQAAFLNTFNEMMTKDLISQAMIQYYVWQILLLSCRALILSDTKKYISGDNQSQSQKLVYSIINYIDTNVCGIRQLEDIGKQVGYSYAHISRLFKQSQGKSLKDYYNEKRFDKAVEFLNEGLSAGEIAHLLNYRNPSSFSRAFTAHFGQTPSDYRKAHRQEIPAREEKDR